MARWSLANFRIKLINTAVRVVGLARAVAFQLAEVAITGPMERTILAAIRDLRAPPSCA
jgi:hypothetical protein